MPSSDPDRRFADIVEAVDDICAFVGEDGEALFHESKLVRYAVERAQLVISEAAAKLGGEAEAAAPDIPWRAIRSYGNYLRHEYDQMLDDETWRIVENELQDLRCACIAALRARGATDLA